MSKQKYEIGSFKYIVTGDQQTNLIDLINTIYYGEVDLSQHSHHQSKLQEQYSQSILSSGKQQSMNQNMSESEIQKKQTKHWKYYTQGQIFWYPIYLEKDSVFNMLFVPIQESVYDYMNNYIQINDSKGLIYVTNANKQEKVNQAIDFYKEFYSNKNHMELRFNIFKALLKNKNFQEQLSLTFFEDKTEELEYVQYKLDVLLVFIIDKKTQSQNEYFLDENYLIDQKINYLIFDVDDYKQSFIDLCSYLIQQIYQIENVHQLSKSLESFFEQINIIK